ncbi:MAG TPA: hypothetical protein VKR58_03790, partial [Aquella sp.]|nr:hypothetical protein [Aquella sp.]
EPHGFLKAESYDYATVYTYEDGTAERGPFDYNKFRNFWYNHEFAPRGNPVLINKLLGGDFNITIDMINSMVVEYLTGISFVFNYYFIGASNINLKWSYKYYHTPLLGDIYSYIASQGIPILESQITGWIPPVDNRFANVFQQLLSILPPQSIGLLPPEFRWFMIDPRSPIIDYYPIDFDVDLELKDKEYKGVVIIPFVDPDRVVKAVSSLRFTADRFSYLTATGSIKLVRDPRMNEVVCSNRQMVTQAISQQVRGRGRGRGRGGGRGGRGGRGRGRGTPTIQGAPGQNIPVQTTSNITFNPTYNINQGTYENKNDLSFQLPTM